ncbi:MAG: LysR family transcriptional regulator [Bdellovibrionales bacterium]|jgi:DNA-binding transcriptional LysR family regulator|nr:LysR family transcriptional regulator [Bdellovibrionales bacterium]
MIETSQLQTLVAVARARSFSRAAQELGVTQSAISQSIKNLENKIEVKLFKRSGKRVVLTPEGEKLYGLASDFLLQMDDTLEEVRHDKLSMSGKIRIGTLTGVGKSWLAPELLEYSLKYPELTVGITLGFQESLIKDFKNYRLDILILPEESLPPIGEKMLLSEERATLVFPKTEEFENITKNSTLDELTSYPTVLFQHDDPLYLNWCSEKFNATPKKLNVRYVVNSHGNMLQAVQQGLGLAVVPNHVLKRSYYRDKVRTLGTEFEISNGNFYLVYHKESEDLLRIKKTLERLKSIPNPLASGLE